MKKTLNYFFILFLIFFSKTSFSQNQTPDKAFKDVLYKEYHSDILNEKRDLYVFAPKDANVKSYPVIYMLDAEMTRPYGLVLEYVKSNPHIIVGIGTRENRSRDMIPVKISSRPGSGGAYNFLNFLTTELKPYIDQNYKTTGKDILLGASNAGLFTIYTMLTQPSQFSSYISLSPTVGHCNEFMTDLINKDHPTDVMKGKYLYILYGLKNEMSRVTDYVPQFSELIKTKFPALMFYCEGLEESGHVPMEGFQEGFKYIYGN